MFSKNMTMKPIMASSSNSATPIPAPANS
jgi:hypothetical protein